jgi:hypothetical protein
MNDTPGSLRSERERTIDALCQQFADEALSMGELERRLTQAREARSRQELDALLRDLPGAGVPARAPSRQAAPSRERTPVRTPEDLEPRTSSQAAIAIMGGTRRAGRWVPPSDMVAVAIMGGVELDFRDAVLSAEVTEINCFAFWGGVEITVPPDVHVHTHGFALMGAFEQHSDLESRPAPGAPTIRVNGFALMGGVDVKVRERGMDGKKKLRK